MNIINTNEVINPPTEMTAATQKMLATKSKKVNTPTTLLVSAKII